MASLIQEYRELMSRYDKVSKLCLELKKERDQLNKLVNQLELSHKEEVEKLKSQLLKYEQDSKSNSNKTSKKQKKTVKEEVVEDVKEEVIQEVQPEVKEELVVTFDPEEPKTSESIENVDETSDECGDVRLETTELPVKEENAEEETLSEIDDFLNEEEIENPLFDSSESESDSDSETTPKKRGGRRRKKDNNITE